MAIPVLLILAVLWAVVLIPPLFKAHHERRHGDSIGDFSFKLGVIGRTGGHTPARIAGPTPLPIGSAAAAMGAPPARIGTAPGGVSPLQRRRRDILVGLFAAAVTVFLAALVTTSTMVWGLQLLVDVLLITYIVLLARMRALAAEQRVKVRYLPQPAPQLALRRTASS